MIITVRDIVAAASQIWRISPDNIMGAMKFREYVFPRQAVYLVASEAGISYSQIGRRMNGRDHSSVIHGCRAIQKKADQCPTTQARLDALRAQVFGTEIREAA